MIQIGLKLWSTNKNYVAEAVRLYEKGVYQYIELTAVPGSFVEYAQIWAQVKDLLKVPFVIHAPHFAQKMNLADSNCFENNKILVHETLQLADLVDATFVIFHPGIGGKTEETVRQLKLFFDSRMVIENKPYIVPGGLVCNGYAPEEIDFIMQETGIGFCFDAGHAICAANAQKIDQIAYIKKFLALKPRMFHLTDGDWQGMYDQHDHLGHASFKLKDIVALYPSDGMLTLETVHDFQDSLRDFERDVAYVRMLESQINAGRFYVVPACKSDAKNIFDLSNDPLVRKNSINAEAIEWEGHLVWFDHKLADGDTLFYVLKSVHNDFMGYVRFDLDSAEAYIMTIHLIEAWRGKGLGKDIIQQATAYALQRSGIKRVIAYIKEHNIASLKSFEKARYQNVEKKQINNNFYHVMLYEPSNY